MPVTDIYDATVRQHANSSRADVSRRRFLQAAGMSSLSLLSLPGVQGAANQLHKRPKVAAVFTEFTHRSHAHVILENFLQHYLFNGEPTDPGVDVVSFYADQFPQGRDMSREVARQFDVPLFDTIDEALCRGGNKLAVDAVLAIGEHGDYPYNDLGQHMYPRKRFFDEIVAVMHRSGRYVPLFNDKHLSYRWGWAKEMYDVTQEHGIAFMAGSSVPLAQRRPQLELPAGAQLETAVSIHGGGVESYDFHALEVLQSMVEARRGGEAGVSRVEFLAGDALIRAAEEGRWSRELAEAAMRAELGERSWTMNQVEGEGPVEPHGVLLEYRDGFRAAVLKIGGSGTRWNFACRLKDEPKVRATAFYVGPWQNRNLFKALSHAIQHHFVHGKPPYPVERTLLVTGILDASMHSRHEKRPIDTPHLEFAYQPRDFRSMREMGASWNIITDETPQPEGIVPHGLK